jgi:uncharacterized protein YjbI with pentapeptide repeats
VIDSYLAIANSPLLWVFLIMVVAAFVIMKVTTLEVKPKHFEAGWLRKNYVGILMGAATLLAVSALYFYIIGIGVSLSSIVGKMRLAASDETATPEDLRHLGTTVALLMGVLAAAATIIFSIIRVWINERTASAAEEALFNEKINNAVNDLHAQRQITLWDEADHPTGWQDDVTRRNGAIDRLEGLAGEEPKAAPRIARMLSVYVRELSREHPPEDPPESEDPGVLRDWVRTLIATRSDMQNATQVLGRLKKTTGLPLNSGEIDLTGVNMQGFDLLHSVFDNAKMQGAKLQGADLIEAKLQGADLRWAQLQGAYLIEAQLQGANLSQAKLQGAYLIEAQLQGADLSRTKFHGAQLSQAQLQGADLQRAEFDKSTSFSVATLRGAALKDVDLTHATISLEQLQDTFGDASVTLPGGHGPDHENWPDRWNKEELDWFNFLIEWRAFQRSIGQDPDNPT